MREEQKAVAEFVRAHGLQATAQVRLLDLDAKEALEGALEKYERRMAEQGHTGSGR